ncbi:Fe superoxide dismutase-like protein [Dendryphion nanum]|uniref:Fe superoxide dismutase-like protein n=1 Tax=Dendryphion nanum TaxID=256645 RepID=A0A9P9ISW9_9PLEO|nr:Fe superoxide dismutase-like protein [Dendryphion nanum]
MIIRSLLRRPSAVQSLVATPARRIFSPLLSIRHEHTRPTLANHEQLRQNGIPGLFSPKGFSIAYDQYQEALVDDLNTLTAGKPEENLNVQDLLIRWARDPMHAWNFNVASMAYNNHFFFCGLATNPDVESTPTSDLTAKINDDFSSLHSLREEFLNTADAMFGPGFVWLVQLNKIEGRPLRILPTYIAGSPLSGAHYRRQSHDLNTHNPDSYKGLNPVGTFGQAAQIQDNTPKPPLGGVDITPLLCLNTWEHVWLHDYGIRGKSEYFQAWWDKINWDFVQSKGLFARVSGDAQRNNFKS